MNRLVAVILLSAGCATARPVPTPSAQPILRAPASDSLRIADLRRRAMAALALARENAAPGLGSGPTCPMRIILADTGVAPMRVFRPDSSVRHTIVIVPPGCRARPV